MQLNEVMRFHCFKGVAKGGGDSIEQKEAHIQEKAGQGGKIQTKRNGLSCKM